MRKDGDIYMNVLSVTIMMVINEKLYLSGLITKDQKEKMEKEIRNLLN